MGTNVSNVAALDGFYTQVDDEGQETADLERFLSVIESQATPAFSALLDGPRWAFPHPWPGFPANHREAIAWFLAAQILRTTRQRKRLAALRGKTELPLPSLLRDQELGNEHARFLISQIASLAFLINQRPWGIGMINACLLTTDTPVVILNDHDADDQVGAASFWEILFPLDPHRLLFLPSVPMVGEDPKKRVDHQFVLESGLGFAINQATYDAADSFVFMHPDHLPHVLPSEAGRLALPGSPEFGAPNEWFIPYSVLADDLTIERKWVSSHVPSADTPTSS